MEPTSETL